MKNNDILRRLRYTFNFDNTQMMAIFASADCQVSRDEISNWLKKDDDPAYKACSDASFTSFLNGFINEKRGKKEGPAPDIQKQLTNNMVLMKLKIALNFQADDIIAVLSLAKFNLSKHELSAFFRRANHKHYRQCKDQVLRNFLNGLQIKYRAKVEAEVKPKTSFNWPQPRKNKKL